MFKRTLELLAIASAAIALAACEGTMGTKDEESSEAQVVESTSSSAGGSTDSSSTSGVSTGGGFQGHPLDDPASPLSQRVVYFDFDSASIRDGDRPTVEAHAQYLATNPAATITLEGHADERGTREYNLGLGERRAVAIRQLMGLLGAGAPQMRVISYGEERPAVDGHDEGAWQQNRRVEIIYRTR